MSRPAHDRRRLGRPAVWESLEPRQLLSASPVVAISRPALHHATPAPVVARPAVGHAATIRHADDEGDEGGNGDSGSSDSGTSDDGSSDDGSADPGTSDGSATTQPSGGPGDNGNGGSVDAGGPTTSPADGGSSDGTTTVTTPVDGGATGSTADAPTTASSPGDPTVPDGEYALLYPNGNACDDALYDTPVAADDGAVGLPVRVGAVDFGGTLRVRLPANPAAGTAGTAVVDVFNTGGRADGRFRIDLGITPNGSAGDAVRVADPVVSVDLGHDRVTTYSIPFRLPADVGAGTYQFIALIDAGNAFEESDESNNVAVGPAVNVAAAVSDLKVTAATTHATAKAGKRSTVAVHLQDVGTGAVSGTVTITVTATPVDGLGPAVVVATVPRPVRLYAGRRRASPCNCRRCRPGGTSSPWRCHRSRRGTWTRPTSRQRRRSPWSRPSR